ncbi:MAG: hypothetical protein K9W43_12330 [Candidatus Thorarchaeota archaeon]|nr:hypothetical protein [Candidatus Thorarchaeota archaeon]
MVFRFVEDKRLAKAKKISDSKVSLHIIRERPLSLWASIQGSAKDPYYIAIDLEMGVVGHVCPDFLRSKSRPSDMTLGWCKHLGKILLMLDDVQVGELYQAVESLRIIKSETALAEIIERIKMKAQKSPEENEVSLRDSLAHAVKSSTISDEELDAIREKLRAEIGQGSLFYRLMHMASILEESQQFAKVVMPLMIPYWRRAEQDFFTAFWSVGGIHRLDVAYLLAHIGRQLGLSVSIDLLQVPKDLLREEVADAKITLDVMGLEHRAFRRVSDDLVQQRMERLLFLLGITEAKVDDVRQYIESHTRKMHVDENKPQVDDFLIYCLQSVHHTTPLDIRKYERKKSYVLPREILDDPVLSFVLKSISATRSLELTIEEVYVHRTLFDWLKDPTDETIWIERPRKWTPDNLLNPGGYIVQWAVNSTRFHHEFLHAYDATDRLVIDPTSPIYPEIQPFDLTLCQAASQRGLGLERVVRPMNILSPEQTVRLVLKGTKIISNVLPWSVLQEFARVGVVKAGEIAAAVRECRGLRFVYGSHALEQALLAIQHLGSSGMSQKKYSEFHVILRTSPRRTTVDVARIAQQIILNEGPECQLLTSIVATKNDHLRLVASIARSTDNIIKFRKDLCTAIVEHVIGQSIYEGILTKIVKSDLRHYEMFKDILKQHIMADLVKAESVLASNPDSQAIRQNRLLQILTKSVTTPRSGPVSSQVLEEFNRLVGEIHKLVD